MAVYNLYVKKNSNSYVQQNRTWSVGDLMVYDYENDFSLNINTHNSTTAAMAYVWECTTGGTSTARPTWPTTGVTPNTTTVTQNGVVWTARTPGYNSSSQLSWAFAAPCLTTAECYINSVLFPTGSEGSADDIINVYVSKNHVETFGLGFGNSETYYKPRVFVVSVNDSVIPPVSREAGASIRGINGASQYNVLPCYYIYGLTCSYVLGAEHVESCTMYIQAGYTATVFGLVRNLTIKYDTGASGLLVLHATKLIDAVIDPTSGTPDELFWCVPDINSEIDGVDASSASTSVPFMTIYCGTSQPAFIYALET